MTAPEAEVVSTDDVVLQWEAERLRAIPLSRCTVCPNGLLMREPVEQVGDLRWLTAVCSWCGHTVVSPGGRTAPNRSHAVRGVTAPADFRRRVLWQRDGERDYRERAAGPDA